MLDTLVSSKKEEFPDFHQEYFSNRAIVDYRGSALVIRGIVTDENGNPIKNVVVSIPSIDAETKTTEKGYYEFKSLPAGIQTLKFNRVNYQEVIENVGIVKEERVQLNVTLKNLQSNQGAA